MLRRLLQRRPKYPDAIAARLSVLRHLLKRKTDDDLVIRAVSLYEELITPAIHEEAVIVIKTPDGQERLVDLREAVVARRALEEE